MISREEIIESIIHELPMPDNEILQGVYNTILPKIKYRWDSDAFEEEIEWGLKTLNLEAFS